MIKETTSYYAVCDVCREDPTGSFEQNWGDQASAIEEARDIYEWFATDDGYALCGTADSAHITAAAAIAVDINTDPDLWNNLIAIYPHLEQDQP